MIEFSKDRPIYLQISDDIAESIVNNTIASGDRLPSIRELASNYTVNPNTIQKVMNQLALWDLIEVVRGIGTIVSSEKHIEVYRQSVYEKEIKEFTRKLKKKHHLLEDVITRIKEEWDK